MVSDGTLNIFKQYNTIQISDQPSGLNNFLHCDTQQLLRDRIAFTSIDISLMRIVRHIPYDDCSLFKHDAFALLREEAISRAYVSVHVSQLNEIILSLMTVIVTSGNSKTDSAHHTICRGKRELDLAGSLR